MAFFTRVWEWKVSGRPNSDEDFVCVNSVTSTQGYSTLTFASTVKNIKIKAKPATAVDKDALVKSLQEELQHLKDAMLQNNMKLLQKLFSPHFVPISVSTLSHFFFVFVFLVLSLFFLIFSILLVILMISKRCWLLKDMRLFMAAFLFPIIRVQWKIWKLDETGCPQIVRCL